jgi:PAS domain-containing protein
MRTRVEVAFERQEAIHFEEERGGMFYRGIVYPVVESGVRPNMAWLMIFDVTEKRRATGLLRESEERYRILVGNAGDAIVVAQDERIKFMNRKGGETLGVTDEDLLQRPFTDFIHGEDRPRIMRGYLASARGEQSSSSWPLMLSSSG